MRLNQSYTKPVFLLVAAATRENTAFGVHSMK